MARQRLASLDAFRGLTIAGMILVNNPGSEEHVYPPLRHAEWHGWTPADLVFPFFVFIVGVSIALAISRRKGEGAGRGDLYFKIFKRSLLIFSLGIVLRLFPRFDFETLRIPGVLQRIALCYLFAALLYVHTGVRGRVGIAVLVLAAYWAVLRFVPVPGYGAGILDYEGNLAGYIDLKFLAGHLYKPGFDPEGILSTFPAIVTAILGTLAGDWLRSARRNSTKILGLLAAGAGLAGLGLALHPYFPINKQIWTSTFVLFTAGAALLLLAAGYLTIDVLGWRRWAVPLFVFGTNAIAAYVGSILLAKILLWIKVWSGGERINLVSWIYRNAFVPWAGNINGSLAFALGFVLLWLALMTPLYRKKIFIKI
ncbi:MAG: heparan-alpha-glucosaminide N-acetyltransferase domain-containing protein [Candidatus Aminicenantes bacterium]|nr:heparan-alpha-glucosaminide N-acetyltransferase domain-containing protein [Candidatus Aminicenantes bacterium]